MTETGDLFAAAAPPPPAAPRLGRACMICAGENAPFGLGMPGFRREIWSFYDFEAAP